uniref:(northern house mosquito) hypothetical protein n=1 Tax=Culex pipiens TaxID=7175 RepID=A0A8D8JQS7_CULPI
MIKRKIRRQRERLTNRRRRTSQKMGRLRPTRLRKLQTRRQRARRTTRRQSSSTPVHPSIHSFPFLSFYSFIFPLSLFSLSLSSSLNNLLSAHHHQRNIFITEFVNTGSGF